MKELPKIVILNCKKTKINYVIVIIIKSLQEQPTNQTKEESKVKSISKSYFSSLLSSEGHILKEIKLLVSSTSYFLCCYCPRRANFVIMD